MFCKQCGKPIDDGEELCEDCKKVINNETTTTPEPETKENTSSQNTTANPNAKSKLAAALFGIFLGTFGVHNFYLGYNGKAIAQLLITILSCGALAFVSAIWGLIEGILILTGSITADADGNEFRD